ncbi:hypothetical protein psyc5s11_29870 [Clostridium gelidum]|uniref:Uncharacterized protein n=1 Tax=Clostridium gelidum TaxID=704125 RepID=A0ABN6IXS1_9CLOT|nr:hypothetical protein psyc5s11_29870 [Clostridium gelidum]
MSNYSKLKVHYILNCKNLLIFLYIKEFVLRFMLDFIGIRININIEHVHKLLNIREQ